MNAAATLANLRVRVIASDPLVRDALGDALAGLAGIDIVETRSEPSLGRVDADVTLWDLGLRPEMAMAALGQAVEAGQTVLALVPAGAGVGEALFAGAAGVLTRTSEPEPLAAGVAAVAQGLTVLDAEARDSFLASPSGDESGFPLQPLTPRETEVLSLLAKGWTNRVIGDALGISAHTAKFHVNAILGKLGAEGRTEAVIRAARIGLITL